MKSTTRNARSLNGSPEPSRINGAASLHIDASRGGLVKTSSPAKAKNSAPPNLSLLPGIFRHRDSERLVILRAKLDSKKQTLETTRAEIARISSSRPKNEYLPPSPKPEWNAKWVKILFLLCLAALVGFLSIAVGSSYIQENSSTGSLWMAIGIPLIILIATGCLEYIVETMNFRYANHCRVIVIVTMLGLVVYEVTNKFYYSDPTESAEEYTDYNSKDPAIKAPVAGEGPRIYYGRLYFGLMMLETAILGIVISAMRTLSLSTLTTEAKTFYHQMDNLQGKEQKLLSEIGSIQGKIVYILGVEAQPRQA